MDYLVMVLIFAVVIAVLGYVLWRGIVKRHADDITGRE